MKFFMKYFQLNKFHNTLSDKIANYFRFSVKNYQTSQKNGNKQIYEF